jgi:hypothetical protein
MNKLQSTTIGSGTVPHIGYGPPHELDPNRFPIHDSRRDLRTRVGDNVVVLNPEDSSVSIGLRSMAVTVGTGATPLPDDPLPYRRALVVHNNSASTVFIGGSSVTVSDGLPLAAGEKISFDIQNNPNVVVYAVAGSSVDVRIMELA